VTTHDISSSVATGKASWINAATEDTGFLPMGNGYSQNETTPYDWLQTLFYDWLRWLTFMPITGGRLDHLDRKFSEVTRFGKEALGEALGQTITTFARA
jgi:hypothetical protein